MASIEQEQDNAFFTAQYIFLARALNVTAVRIAQVSTKVVAPPERLSAVSVLQGKPIMAIVLLPVDTTSN